MDIQIQLFESIAMKWSKKANVELQEQIILAASAHAEMIADAAWRLEAETSLPSVYDVIFEDSDDDDEF
jgi:hypothetical protein